jgi:anti-sigma regulatory factor (Ser/Thr protein kinase)
VCSSDLGTSPVRAFGEMVALLWGAGNVKAAMALESLWNDLAASRQFSLLCAYPTSALRVAGLAVVNETCDLHSTVHPPAGYSSEFSGDAEVESATYSGVFLAVPEAVAAARRLISAALTAWGEHHLLGDAALIISELATNAIIHGNSAFRAGIQRVGNIVRIAVEDLGAGLPQSPTLSGEAISGRGVAIVEELAHRWGFDRLSEGKVLWAELRTAHDPAHRPTPTAQRSERDHERLGQLLSD